MNRDHRPPSIAIVGSNCKVDELRIFWEEKSPGSAGSGNFTPKSPRRPFQFPTRDDTIAESAESTDKSSQKIDADSRSGAGKGNAVWTEDTKQPQSSRVVWKNTKSIQHRATGARTENSRIVGVNQQLEFKPTPIVMRRNSALRSTFHGCPNRGTSDGFWSKKADRKASQPENVTPSPFQRRKLFTSSLRSSFRKKKAGSKTPPEKTKTEVTTTPVTKRVGRGSMDYLTADEMKFRRRSHSYSEADRAAQRKRSQDSAACLHYPDDAASSSGSLSNSDTRKASKKGLKVLIKSSDLLRRLSPDRRRSPKTSTENLANLSDSVGTRLAGAGSTGSIASNNSDQVDSPFKSGFRKNSGTSIGKDSGITTPTKNRRRNAVDMSKPDLFEMDSKKEKAAASPKKFSARSSIRKKFGKITDSKPNNAASGSGIARDSRRNCDGCGFPVNMGGEHVSFKGSHYHRECFKCKKCDQALTLKTSRVSEDTRSSRIIWYPSLEKYARYRQILQRSHSSHEDSKPPQVLKRVASTSAARRVKSFIGTDSNPPPAARLGRRRCAVSASESSPELLKQQDSAEDLVSEEGDMPVKRSIKISTRFIGSLQKHSVPKGKAEKAAAAAAFASALAAQNGRRDAEGGLSCEPCTQSDGMSGKMQSIDSFQGHDDLFAMLEKAQGTRLDEQRSPMPVVSLPADKPVYTYPSIQEVLRKGAPYPQVIPPPQGGYWAQGFHPESPYLSADIAKEQPAMISDRLSIEREETVTSYRRHFHGKEHVNFYAFDENLGPLVMSVKHEDSVTSEAGFTRLLLRSRAQSWAKRFESYEGGNPAHWAKNLCDEITTDRFYPVVSTGAWDSILNFDEHTVTPTNKFGILYQKPNQAKEEEVFGNRGESPAFREFLEFVGDVVDLQGFTGFRGGLDVQHGHTGDTSVYGRYADKEVMFHVSTMLPYIEGDRQQLQRKRHIGNDIVAIVFQDGETPFVPNMITSHFLHAYIVIQPIDACTPDCRYKVSVTCREDVPDFEPSLPEPAIFSKDDAFREWLYCKMVNAEWACYKSEQFAKLQFRTRTMLMDQLYDEIAVSTEAMLGIKMEPHDNLSNASSADTVKEGSNGFFEAFKRFTRHRASSIDHQTASPLMSTRKVNLDSKHSSTSSSFNDHGKSPAKFNANLERSATFDENDRQRLKSEPSTLQHGNDSGNNSDLTLDCRSAQGSSLSLSESPKKARRNRPHSPCPSCGSYNSLDSDTGLESMASSSRTDSWPRNGAHEGGGPHHNCVGVDHNQNKRSNHNKTNAVERKHSDGDHGKGELAKLRKDWARLQQENMNLQKELKKLRDARAGDSGLGKKLDQIGVPDAVPTTAEHLV